MSTCEHAFRDSLQSRRDPNMRSRISGGRIKRDGPTMLTKPRWWFEREVPLWQMTTTGPPKSYLRRHHPSYCITTWTLPNIRQSFTFTHYHPYMSAKWLTTKQTLRLITALFSCLTPIKHAFASTSLLVPINSDRRCLR